MGKKQKKTSQADVAVDAKHEQPLQAVLLADSFVNSFRPLSLDRPKVLCPLNNVTMIDYAIDFLAGTGVEELFVVCVSDQVENHVQSQAAHHTIQVTIIKDPSLDNAGDALRELDRRDMVQSDPFILMFGDIVTNVDVSGALAAHKERHNKDRSAIMTLLMKPVGESNQVNGLHYSSIRANTEDLVVGIDPTQDNRILVYDDNCPKTSVPIPCSFFASHPQVDMRTDLLDCGIDICSPDVLARFTDTFDYLDIRRKFVANSVAEEEEVLQNKIFVHMLRPSEYAARIDDFSTYQAVSRDLLRRWCYPVVPDNLPSGYEKQYRYNLQRHYMYHECKNGKARIGRSSQVHGAGMIGSCCFIGENCRIEGTVMGNNCHVAAKASLRNCFLWDAVEVGEGATVVQSILADGCVIKAGAVVNRGCIIGAGCVIGEGVVLPEFTRVTLAEERDGDDFSDDWDEGSEKGQEEGTSAEEASVEDGVVSHTHVVGPDGKGRVWQPPPEDEEDEDLYGLSSTEVAKAQCIGFDPTLLYAERLRLQKVQDDGFSDDEDAVEHALDSDLEKYKDGAVTFASGEMAAPAYTIGRQEGVDVIDELKSICLEYEPTSPIENLAIELNSYKFSQNATYSDCTTAAMLAILEQMNITADTSDGKLVADFKSYLDHWAPLLQKMSIGLDEEKAIVEALENSATQEGEMGQVLSTGVSFRFLLQTLHDEEIVSEEAILGWAAERRAEAEDSLRAKLFRLKPVQDFLEWLEKETEDEGDSDEEEEDSDED